MAGQGMRRQQRQAGVQAPRIDPLPLEGLAEGVPARLVARGDFEGERFAGVDAEGMDLVGTTFMECELVNWSADGAELQGARFVQTRITQLNAPKLGLRRTAWRDVEVHESRLGAVECYESDLAGVVIADSKLGWVNLRASKLRDVVFRGCRFDELDLSGSTLDRVAFEDTTVDKLVLTGVRGQHVDLRGMELRVLEGFDGLRGTVLSSSQTVLMAELFAGHLGVRVEG